MEKVLQYSVFEVRDDPLFVRDIEALAAWCRLRAIPRAMLSEVPIPVSIPAYAATALKTLSGAVDTLRLILMECLMAGKAGPTIPSNSEILHLSRYVLNRWGAYLNAIQEDDPGEERLTKG